MTSLQLAIGDWQKMMSNRHLPTANCQLPTANCRLTLWGSGTPRREFLYVDDLADAVVFLMNNYDAKDIGEFVNIWTGNDLTIKELAEMVKHIVGFKGAVEWDKDKPDGTPQKLLAVERLHNLGWKYSTPLYEGIEKSYNWFINKYHNQTL